jgi:hypothetical protein
VIPVAYLAALTLHRDYLMAAVENLRPVSLLRRQMSFSAAAFLRQSRALKGPTRQNCFCPSRRSASKGLRLIDMSHSLLMCCWEIWQVPSA